VPPHPPQARPRNSAARREPQDIVFAEASYPKSWGDCNGEERPREGPRPASRRRGKRTRANVRGARPGPGWPAHSLPATRRACSSKGSLERSPARSASAQPPDQARGIPAPAAHLRDLVVEAGDRLSDRELRAVLLCGLGADAQVLPHPVHGETEVELVVDHGLAAIFHLPGLRRAL